MIVLEEVVPAWRELRILEAAPIGAGSVRMAQECRHYTPTAFRDSAVPGHDFAGIKTEDLEHLSFERDSFDVIVTQDVFEHVVDPARGLMEIARVLRPGGYHIFTVPCDFNIKTRFRVQRSSDGSLVDLLPKVWHGDPYDDTGALVITDWGYDIVERIEQYCGMITEIHRKHDRRLGLLGPQLEVFVSRRV